MVDANTATGGSVVSAWKVTFKTEPRDCGRIPLKSEKLLRRRRDASSQSRDADFMTLINEGLGVGRAVRLAPQKSMGVRVRQAVGECVFHDMVASPT